jgi:hypothetical protein
MARKAYLSAISVAIILVVAIVTSTGFGSVDIAQGQGNLTQGNETAGNVTLTPEQKDAICNPNNPLSKLNPVNTTESKLCGIPKTLNATNSTASNMTTGEETPPTASSIAPSANTTTGAQRSSSDLASQMLRNLGGNQTTTGAQRSAPSNLAPSAAPPPEE